MKSFQQRTIEEIERIAAKYKVECTQSQAYANTGQINLHEQGNHVPFGFVHYDFQPGTYKLSITVRGVTIPSQKGRHDYYNFYQHNEEYSRFWSVFHRIMQERNAWPWNEESAIAHAEKAV